MAACLSVGFNGMAAALIAVGSHSLRPRETVPTIDKPRAS